MTCTSWVSLQQPLNPQVREEWSVSSWADQEGNTKCWGWPGLARKVGRCGNFEVKRCRCTRIQLLPGTVLANVAASSGAGCCLCCCGWEAGQEVSTAYTPGRSREVPRHL